MPVTGRAQRLKGHSQRFYKGKEVDRWESVILGELRGRWLGFCGKANNFCGYAYPSSNLDSVISCILVKLSNYFMPDSLIKWVL